MCCLLFVWVWLSLRVLVGVVVRVVLIIIGCVNGWFGRKVGRFELMWFRLMVGRCC